MNNIASASSLLGALAEPNRDNPLLAGARQKPAPHHAEHGHPSRRPITAAAIGAQSMWQVRMSNTLTFELTTQEGDRVQVSVRQKLGAMQQTTLVAAGATDGQNTALVGSLSQLQAGQFEAGIGIHVQGDLNEDELAALQAVMKQVGELAQDFFNGDMQGALDELSQMHFDKSQLAYFDLNMRQRVQVHQRQQAAVQVYQQVVRPGHGPRPAHPLVQQLRVEQWQAQMTQAEQSLSAHFRFADTSVEGMMAALGSEDGQDVDALTQVIQQLRQQMAELLGTRLDAPTANETETGEENEQTGEAAADQASAAQAAEQESVESSAARAEANTPRPETSTA
ncbi:hypothetical protein SAMN05443662_1443 [Sulfurivirga caldicuralii]|uniref:DUF5610 domain-containing protein n=1 Tax=Sulfurivirga caldicuralii TaxID=364032 RepID=A0A1N6GPV0_9GAMM|nr:hypothetical protein [Sulfurivirga caldicuralii]SIO09596.1 hypothetical protein SAMN05443662_1443 [Sulfurivirga caldicuralii]